MFEGFTQETTDFLWGILLNNNREWFMPHKEQYTRTLYQPLKELAYEVQESVLDACPERQLACKVTRIYRDTRIPQPEGPYKTGLWFSLQEPDAIWGLHPCLYFVIEGGGYEIGMDYYCAYPAGMERYRTRILEHPEQLRPLVKHLAERPEYKLEGKEYARSKGTVEPLLQPWFNRKSVTISHFHEPEGSNLYSPELKKEIIDDFLWLLPFYDYFKSLPTEGLARYERKR